jgi:hypothetical protein
MGEQRLGVQQKECPLSEQTTVSAATTTARQGEPDTSAPTPERQAELRAAYEANVAADKPPHERVKTRTLGELEWIRRERDWTTDPFNHEDKQSFDLSGADLSYANLSRAILVAADLSGADLSYADLSGAGRKGAILPGVHFYNADLSGTVLGGVDLSGADLSYANLSGTNLTGVRLSDANLSSARMDAGTQLAAARLDNRTRLVGVVWNGVPLDVVATWPTRLGDEQGIVKAKGRQWRIHAYRDAARAYRGLCLALRSQGLLITASNYRLREQVLERKAKFLEFSLLGWVFSWLLNLVAGYGERPVRSFVAYLLVLFGFAGAYFALGSGALAGFGLSGHDAITSPLSALVFSVTSFHGRGFFPSGLALDDPLTVLAAAEAVIGLFIEITFNATFTQRFFGGR